MKFEIVVKTPAGELKVKTVSEALEYKRLYGYPYEVRKLK